MTIKVEHVPSGRRLAPIPALTGLRGLAALDVMLIHIGQGPVPALKWIAFHNPAVDIFFCLSSFTLCLVYQPGTGRPLALRAFAIARFARVYPLYAVVLVLSGIYTAAWGLDQFNAYSWNALFKDGFCQLFMINAWPVIGTGAHWVAPMWSLSIEALCYAAVFPILFALSPVARKVSGNWLLFGTIVTGFMTFTVYMLLYNPVLNVHRVPAATGFLVHWVAAIRGVCMFGAGWFAYLLYLSHSDYARAAGRLTDVTFVTMTMVVASQSLGTLNAEFLVVLTPMLILGLLDRETWTARLLSSPPLYFLGLISYSLYLWHWPAMTLIDHVLLASPGYRFLAALGLTFVVAIPSYYFIEKPARISIRKLIGRRTRSPRPCFTATNEGRPPD